MKRRSRRNPGSNGFPILNRSKYEERTYYNDEYRDPAVLKTILIIAVVLLTIGAIVLIAKAAFFSGNKSKQATKYIPTPTHSIPDSTNNPSGNDGTSDAVTTAEPDNNQSPDNTQSPENTPAQNTGSHNLSYGTSSNDVIELQKRLAELGFLRINEPTDYYGDATKTAVYAFQRQHSLEKTGNVDDATYDLLFSSNAKEYVLKDGDEGEDVREFQRMLKALNYITADDITGKYGSVTRHAVRDFQDRNDLETTSIADRETMDLIYQYYIKKR